MNGLTLQLRPTPGRIDMHGIVPDRLIGLDEEGIAAVPVAHDGVVKRLDELFTIVDGDRQRLTLSGDLSGCDRIAGGMQSGWMLVTSSAGHRLADRMVGGNLQVTGSAGDFACSRMRGGVVEIGGTVGDYCGAALPSLRRGMQGGICVVGGNAGRYTGYRMRRGTLIVQGDVDLGCASSLIAGTIVVLGKLALPWAIGMRRGTLIVATEAMPKTHAGFTPLEPIRLSYLPLVLEELQRYLPAERMTRLRSGRVWRALGDRANCGLGELLWISAPADSESQVG